MAATLLAEGQVVSLEAAKLPCRVQRLLGQGGQGEVYEATVPSSTTSTQTTYALKWYYPPMATREQRAALAKLIEIGRPNDRFLWPIDLASSPQAPAFGYLMPLRQARYRSIVDLLMGRVPWSARTVARTGFELADCFLRVHSKGLCYRDINFGNVFFDPAAGDVLVCDNDNVGVDGERAQILGAPRFMAPEIVRGEAEPSIRTDLYSLSVLLFYLCFAHHPLEGARELEYPVLDRTAMRELFGTRALFIFDPDDDSNRPLPGMHDNAIIFWALFPTYLRKIFTEAFTAGLRDPVQGRVRESVWKGAMATLRDLIVDCFACGAENFVDPDADPTEQRRCWNRSCQAEIQPRFALRIGSHQVVVLNAKTELFPHHVKNRLYDYTAAVAAVSQHPRDTAVWGLHNLGDAEWTATEADGSKIRVAAGRNVRLSDGLTIDFGGVRGTVRTSVTRK